MADYTNAGTDTSTNQLPPAEMGAALAADAGQQSQDLGTIHILHSRAFYARPFWPYGASVAYFAMVGCWAYRSVRGRTCSSRLATSSLNFLGLEMVTG